jgi:hypothetical protein
MFFLALSDVISNAGAYTLKQAFEIYVQYFISFLLSPAEFGDIFHSRNKSIYMLF